MRSERAIPLFEYIVRKIDRKGPLRSVYLRAVESLGALKAEHTVDLLKDALYTGEWWAPFRTAELRRDGCDGAAPDRHGQRRRRVLQEAAQFGPARRARRCTGGAIMIDAADTRSAVRRTDPPLWRVAARHPAVLAHPPDRRAQSRGARRSASCASRSTTRRSSSACSGDELIVGDAADDQGQRVDGRADSPLRRDGHRAHHDRAPGDARRAQGVRGQVRPAREDAQRKRAEGSRRRSSSRRTSASAASRSTSACPKRRPTRPRSAACTPRPSRSPAWCGKARARTRSPIRRRRSR